MTDLTAPSSTFCLMQVEAATRTSTCSSRCPATALTRVYLAPTRKPGPVGVARGLFELARRARGHDLFTSTVKARRRFPPAAAAHRSIVTLHGLHLVRRATGAGSESRRSTAGDPARRRPHDLRLVGRASGAGVGGRRRARRDKDHRRPQRRTAARGLERGGARGDPRGAGHRCFRVRRHLGRIPRRTTRPRRRGAGCGADTGPRSCSSARAASRATSNVRRADTCGYSASATTCHGCCRRADLFVLMSQREGLSFALVEAMAHGLPAVVADIPENIETIGDSGIAVPYGDADAVARAFRSLAADPVERGELAARARRRAAEISRPSR